MNKVALSKYYGPRWADPDRMIPLASFADVSAMKHPCVGVCPASRDWQDYIIYHLNKVIDQYGIDGIYIDCWTPSLCKTEPCGWQGEHGVRHGTWPLRAYRELLRRAYALVHEKRPDALVMVHSSSEMNIPMLSFADATLDGEQFLSGERKVNDDYLDVLPPHMFRAEFLGRNWGPVSFFIPEFRDGNEKAGTPNLAAYLLLHDVNAWPIWSDTAAWNRLYDKLDAAGIGDAEFFPYWDDSGARAGPGVLVSSYRTKSAVVLAVMNTGEATECTIDLDPRRLNLSAISGVADAIRDEPIKAAGRSITVPLARHQGRVLVAVPTR